jgi:hypothetical protein
MTLRCSEPLSDFIATLLDLAPAAIWARIVTSRSQQPRTVKSFAQCDTFFGPPSLPISIERHYKWRKQNHEFVVLGAGVFCRIDLATTLVGPPASRTGRGTRYRTRSPGAAVVAGKLNPCQEPGTAIMGHYDRPAALHLAFVEYGLECMAPIMFMRRMMRPTILQRETRADRQRGEKAVERSDTHALVRRCFRLEGKRRDRRFPDQKTVHPTITRITSDNVCASVLCALATAIAVT